ncbi:MAG: hypothetical protein AAF570_13410, partial [Bacteroidota bacterium]
QASLYHNIGYHKAAVEAFQVMVNEYPDSDFREEAQFLLYKSSVNLAEQSIAAKKIDRYKESLEYHEKFEEKFPGSKFAKEATNLKESAEKALSRLEAERKASAEKKMFNSFKTSIQTVLKTNDATKRETEYAKALDTYKAFQEKYPESAYMTEADKLFKQVEQKQDKEN